MKTEFSSDGPCNSGYAKGEVIKMNYANLSPEAIKMISKLEDEIKEKTGNEVVLVAYPGK